MSDFKFVAFVVFLFIVFGAFSTIYYETQISYLTAQNTTAQNTSEEIEVSSYNQIKEMTDFETNSKYGTMFLSGLGVLMFIIIIRFVRGQ